AWRTRWFRPVKKGTKAVAAARRAAIATGRAAAAVAVAAVVPAAEHPSATVDNTARFPHKESGLFSCRSREPECDAGCARVASLCAGRLAPHDSRPQVSLLAVRGSPDPARQPTAGLPWDALETFGAAGWLARSGDRPQREVTGHSAR